jgi:MFS family permease
MRAGWGLPLDFAGFISVPISICTILSSLFSGYIIKKLGTGKVVTISCIMTGAALLGFSFAPSYIWLILFGIPLGFGAGAVDAGLNNYVALHFMPFGESAQRLALSSCPLHSQVPLPGAADSERFQSYSFPLPPYS